MDAPAVAAALREMWERGQKEERVCRWVDVKSKPLHRAECIGHSTEMFRGYKFCPFCGGRIEVTP